MLPKIKAFFTRVGGKHKTKTFFAVSYLLVLIVPVLVYLAIDSQIKNMVISMAIEQQDTTLKQTIRDVDAEILAVQRTALQLANDSLVQVFTYAQPGLSPNERASVPRLVKALNQYYATQSSVKDFYVYFAKSNTIASRGGFYDPEQYYQLNWSYEGVSQEAWMESLLRSETSIFYLPEATIVQDRQVASVITFHHSLTGKSRTQNTATLILFLDTASIGTKLEENPSHYASYIFDQEGQRVFRCGRAEGLPAEGLLLPAQQDWGLVDSAGGRFLVSQRVSENTRWRYVSMVPYAVILERVSWMNHYVMLGLLFVVILGIPLIIVLARQAYSPIGRLVKEAKELGYGQHTDSLDAVHQSLRMMHSENLSMRKTHQAFLEHKTKNQERVQDGLVMQLARGQLDHIPHLASFLQDMDMAFQHDCFQVVLVQLEDDGKLLPKAEAGNRSLALFTIRSAAGEMFAPLLAYSAVSGYGEVLLLLNMQSPLEEAQVVALCGGFQQSLAEQAHLRMTISIGIPVYGLEQIYKSLESAVNTFAFRMIQGKHAILSYSDHGSFDDSPLRIQPKLEQRLVSALKGGDYEASSALLNSIVDDNYNDNISLNKARKLYIALINMAMRAMDELSVDTENIFGSNYDPIGSLILCQSIDEMLPLIQDAFYQICAFLQGKQDNKHTKLADVAMDYLHQHYAEPGFGLAAMAEGLSVTVEHLSRTIKMETGRNFVDILNQYRVEKAKGYMAGGGQKLSDIATLVGCGSVKTLIRIFKQYEGTTPGKYK